MTYAYRGADGPGGSAFGWTPADIKLYSGFKPWRSYSLPNTRANLRKLVNDGTLATEAGRWCSEKNREDGWFFCVDLNEAIAVRHSLLYLYRFDITDLTQQAWTLLGKSDVPEMQLYLDSNDLDTATKIAVVWIGNPEQLLFMSPVGVDLIDLRIDQNPDVWLPLKDYTGN